MFKSIVKPLLFCYSTQQLTVPANGTIVNNISFSDDSDFVVDEIRQTDQEAGEILVQFRLQAGELFSNGALDSNLFSNGFNGKKFFGVHGYLPRIPGNTQLNVQLQNTTGADIVHEVQIWGYKVDKQQG